VRDPVADATDTLGTALKEEFTEDWINQPGAGGGSSVPQFQIEFVDGSGVPGPDLVRVLAAANTWSFRENFLEDVADGDDSLPTDLMTLLTVQGIQEAAFADQLLSLFPNSGGENDDDDDD
jgi:hypothetical protein